MNLAGAPFSRPVALVIVATILMLLCPRAGDADGPSRDETLKWLNGKLVVRPPTGNCTRVVGSATVVRSIRSIAVTDEWLVVEEVVSVQTNIKVWYLKTYKAKLSGLGKPKLNKGLHEGCARIDLPASSGAKEVEANSSAYDDEALTQPRPGSPREADKLAEITLLVDDEELAKRAAKAFEHLIQSAGGGKAEPF